MKQTTCIRVFIAALFLISVAAIHAGPVFGADIHGEAVEYSGPDGVELKGYIAYDADIKGKRPGVIVVHEWWGHNEYARKRARMLAGLGYTAFALDMFGGGKQAAHPDDAGKFAGEIARNQELGRARFKAAMDVLKKHETVDAERIAAIGYCFGGSIVLNMARSGMDLKGVASFHGGLAGSKPDKPGRIKARVLVNHGGDDVMISAEQVEEFKREMKEEGADMRFITYKGARHSFTNPDADRFAEKFGIPLAYNAKADKKSWEELKSFLESVFE